MFLLRHAETQWNADGIGFGRTDVPLSPAGRATAVNNDLRALSDQGCLRITRIFTSPLSRAQETAAIIAHRYGLPTPVIVPALVERDHGEREGQPKRPRPPVVPGRETDDEVRARALPFFQQLSTDCLIVTHAGVIKAVTGESVTHMEVVEWHP